jgi:hypothetical protein
MREFYIYTDSKDVWQNRKQRITLSLNSIIFIALNKKPFGFNSAFLNFQQIKTVSKTHEALAWCNAKK